MRPLILAATVVVLACISGTLSAGAQDRPDRSLRLDHDSMRNDYREDRLKIPAHPLVEQQVQPATPVAPKGKSAKSKRTGEATR